MVEHINTNICTIKQSRHIFYFVYILQNWTKGKPCGFQMLAQKADFHYSRQNFHKTLTMFPTLVSCHRVYYISLLHDSASCLRFFYLTISNLSFSFSLAHYKLHRHPRDQQRETFTFTGAIPLPVSVLRSIFPSLIFLILPLSSFFYSSHFHPIALG